VVSELITWLRAQLDEDERVALAATAGAWVVTTTDGRSVCGVQALGRLNGIPATSVHCRADAEHIARHDPARVLAEVEAKRRLLDLHDGWHSCGVWECDGDCPTVRLLALPYAGRDGYDETWRPE
jgi:hypothetical protein